MSKQEKNIKFLTDSAADLTPALRKEYDIEVLPFTIISSDSKEYKDGVDFTPQKFYDFLDKQEITPTHAQLTAFDFCEVYERLWTTGYRSVIYTSINSKGSATWQNSIMARDEFYEDHPEAKDEFSIYIIDSLSYTMGYGWGIVQAAKMARDGASAEICAAAIEDWCKHVRLLFTPMDLKYAKKSGRVSAAAAFLGDALGLHPIMSFPEGESKVLTKVRGDKNVIPTMIKMAQKEIAEGSPLLLITGGNKDINKELRKQSTEAFGKADLEYQIGGVITINVGHNLIGMIYRVK